MNRRAFLEGTAALAGSHALFAEGRTDRSKQKSDQRSDLGAASPADSKGRPWIDFRHATVVVRPGDVPPAEATSATVLIEELEKRTLIHLQRSANWPANRPAIVITSTTTVPGWKRTVPSRTGPARPENRKDGYRLYLETGSTFAPVLWILGADPRGTLYGVGELLQCVDWAPNQLRVPAGLDSASSPAFPIRGHQLGYRPQANSYDAWTPAQFEQYIRELTFFGVNSIGGIPFQDHRPDPLMKTPRRKMNQAIGQICNRYGLDYWVWVPVTFSLTDAVKRSQMLEQCAQFFHDTPTLADFFVPGGDPGANPPELVLPFLDDVAKLLSSTHPEAGVWISLQWFTPQQVDYVFNYLQTRSPKWFRGLVGGPSSLPLGETRRRLPKQYMLRDYPDLTHNKLSQYEVPEWDQAYALTEGREASNPRPVEYAAIFARTSGWTDGFLSYSDGVHDDVNKTIWSALAWDPGRKVREILIRYARIYFQPRAARSAAEAILSLEKNWHGPLVENGSVQGTLLQWEQLETANPELARNWRWQLCLLRANYDAYIRNRLIYESALEARANHSLARAAKLGSGAAMQKATDILNLAESQRVTPELRTKIFTLCAELFQSIGLQTSVARYHAVGEERGAVLDFVDHPLNNRWWLEDRFEQIAKLPAEPEKQRQLIELASWEEPGRGSFYDNVGNIAKSPHVVRCDADYGPRLVPEPGPTFWWWDNGKSRARLSWQVTMWPTAVVYEALDPSASYTIRTTGHGQTLLRINGDLIQPNHVVTINDDGQTRQQKDFPVPSKCLAADQVVLTWDKAEGEEHLNWRDKSRLSEVWLLKQPADSSSV